MSTDDLVLMGVERAVGGDEEEEMDLGPPSVQLMLSSVFWRSIINAHQDASVYYVPNLDGESCERSSLRAFIWPLVSPGGAGLTYWEASSAEGSVDGVRERTIDYEPGNLYVFRGNLLHALRWEDRWPVLFGRAYRMNLQAFGLRCGARWYLFH